MTARRLLIVACLLAIGGAVGYVRGGAAADDKQASLEMRMARDRLRLAELTLQKVQELNRKVPGTLIASTVAHFADDVEYAKQQLEMAKKSDAGDPFQSCVVRAEFAVRAAEARLKKAQETNARVAGVVTAADLERLQLGANLARLQLERGRALAGASNEQKLYWVLDFSNDQMESVSQQVFLLGQNRLSQF